MGFDLRLGGVLMRRGEVGVAWVLLAGLAAAAVVPARVEAKATWVKKAQAIDPTIQDCLACHTSKKGRELNATRGQFLGDRKKELGVKDVDLEWLRDYKEPEAKPPADPTQAPGAEATTAPPPAP